MQATSRIFTAMAAVALSSVGAYADKGGGGHGSGHDSDRAAGSAVSSMTASRAGITTAAPRTSMTTTTMAAPRASTTTTVTRGTGTTTSTSRSANGAMHSGLPTGQGRVTADAAHQRNLTRQEARGNRIRTRTRDEVENEIENAPRIERENMRRSR